MKLDKIKHISLRIEDQTLEKFKYICKYDDRSLNGQTLNLIRKCIADFEAKEGEIAIKKTMSND